jgi:hypothetical protein
MLIVVRALLACATVGLTAAVVAGCAAGERPAVERVAAAFADAGNDPARACDLLAPATRAAVETQQARPCAAALNRVPPIGDVRSVEVWGGAAQVRFDRDTLFLTRTGDGWRVAAAGCTPREEAPYDCRVAGP